MREDDASMRSRPASKREEAAGMFVQRTGKRTGFAGMRQEPASLRADSASQREAVAGLRSGLAGKQRDLAGMLDKRTSLREDAASLFLRPANLRDYNACLRFKRIGKRGGLTNMFAAGAGL